MCGWRVIIARSGETIEERDPRGRNDGSLERRLGYMDNNKEAKRETERFVQKSVYIQQMTLLALKKRSSSESLPDI